MKAWIRKLSTPTGSVWILSHTIMILLGTLALSAKSVQTVLGVGVSEGIGGSLVATGVAGISLFLYIASSDAMRARTEMFSKAGLSAIYSGRSVLIRDQYQERLAKAQKIDLIGYGLFSSRGVRSCETMKSACLTPSDIEGCQERLRATRGGQHRQATLRRGRSKSRA